VGHQFEALAARHKLALGATNLAPNIHLLLGAAGRVSTTTASIALQLSADGRGRPVNQASNAAQAEALSLTELNDGALFDAEFGIGHRGSTVPERSGVALSFRGRPLQAFAKRLKAYVEGIVSSAEFQLNTSVLEGMNNRIKVIKRMAYGYRDNTYFFLKIKAAFPGKLR